MKVRIVKASRPSYWYADKIGEVFEVQQDPDCSFKWEVTKNIEALKEENWFVGKWSYIDKEDCKKEPEMITCKEDLEGRILEDNDKVQFTLPDGDVLKYKVFDGIAGPFLCRSSGANDLIFTKLGLEKRNFCQKYYGKYPEDGNWPNAENFEELTRCVKGLYDVIEKKKRKTMDYKKALIRFMELKQAKLGPDYNYFNFEDAKAIEAWSEEDAERVWKEIEDDSLIYEKGIHSGCCPFCKKHGKNDHGLNCGACEYGSNHGKCDEETGSDWGKLNYEHKREFDWVELFDKVKEEFKERKPELKLYSESSEDDPDDTLYLHLEKYHGVFRLMLKNKNDHYSCPISIIPDEKKVTVNEQIFPKGAENFFNIDDTGRIVIEKW